MKQKQDPIAPKDELILHLMVHSKGFYLRKNALMVAAEIINDSLNTMQVNSWNDFLDSIGQSGLYPLRQTKNTFHYCFRFKNYVFDIREFQWRNKPVKGKKHFKDLVEDYVLPMKTLGIKSILAVPQYEKGENL